MFSTLLRCATLAAAASASVHDNVDPTEGERLFALKIRPLLVERCLGCHGDDPDEIQGGLDLTSRDGALRGGDTSREVLVPGNASQSLLYRATTRADPDYVMPPKETDRLTREQAWVIRDWINAGAPWPDEERIARIVRSRRAEPSDGVTVATSGGLASDWNHRRYQPENVWAYRPLRKPPVPGADDETSGRRNPIDVFIDAKLDAAHLDPAPRAPRRTLIRRVTFDLIGLPPTPEEIERFLQDPQSDHDALATVIDRLLASPHYGERWAQHWLDVVRYADTAGLANDFERPNAWRYRDYVIRSFNDDKPYDRFVQEQIAGDEIDPDDPEMLIATGFLRMGPWEQTGMSVAKITRQQFLDDVTDSVGQVFLSHPLQCARCHDHKFDPIPTRDYYRIQAVFATTQFAGRDAPFLPTENTEGFAEERRYLTRQIARYESIQRDLQAKEERAARRWYAERNLPDAPRSRLLKEGVAEDKIAPRHIGLSTKDMGMDRIARKNLTRHRWELDRFEPIAYAVYSGTTRYANNIAGRIRIPGDSGRGGELERTAILAGGDPFSPTETVTPGVLSALSGLSNPGGREDRNAPGSSDAIPTTVGGRRRAFARWVASPDNPLTARSIVNRIWQYHFGQGLAGNPNNFGAMGKKPTHPELLDWLAVRLIEDGWSIKKLHRLIMSSDAYGRSSAHPRRDELDAKDPARIMYACFLPRRLSAEELRDSMLAVSGELNPEMGGIPVRPAINLEAALQPRQIMGTYAPAYQPSPRPDQRNRRSIYVMKIRGLRNPLLEVFNQPSSEKSCERRDTSTVTPQALSLMNGQHTSDRALAMAVRLQSEAETRRETIDRAFALAFGRPPASDELGECLSHWNQMTAVQERVVVPPPKYPTEVERHAIEEMSGEPFSFTEKLDVYEDYVPDLQPCDVGPETRALADVCLVLLNASEFLYVY